MTSVDVNFDNRSNTFKQNIYGSSKGIIREKILTRDLLTITDNTTPLRIVDLGGGQGQMALKLAEKGHKVTLVDISEQMLKDAKEQAGMLGLELDIKQASIQQFTESCSQKFDLVMCHAVFEWLQEPQQAVTCLSRLCLDQGFVSLMFFNQAGRVFSNLVYGNFDYVQQGLKVKKSVKLNPQSALDNETVLTWCEENQLSLHKKTGVRCFHDYLRDLSKQKTELEQIIELELKYSEIEPYASVGRYTHYLLQKENK